MLSDDDFRLLLYHLDRPWAGFRKVRKGVKKKVRRHMAALECSTIQDYLQNIVRDPEARAECERRLAVTISRFFRDRLLWNALSERILPSLARRFPDGLNVWSAGCAGGEEPYTLAMVWKTLSAGLASSPAMQIHATDADAQCLRRARGGLYPNSSLREVPKVFIDRWFRQVHGTRQWQIDKRLQAAVCLKSHDLLCEPLPGIFHLILLRNNLLTYYQGNKMENAFAGIAAALADKGILIVGSHEHPPPSNRHLRRDASCRWIYHAF